MLQHSASLTAPQPAPTAAFGMSECLRHFEKILKTENNGLSEIDVKIDEDWRVQKNSLLSERNIPPSILVNPFVNPLFNQGLG